MTRRVFYPQAHAILQVVFDGFGDTAQDTEPVVIPCLPMSMTVHKNSHRQADSWEITFDAQDLPIDPQLVRAGAAQLYLVQTEQLAPRPVVSIRDQATPKGTAAKEARELGLSRIDAGAKPIVAGLFDRDAIALSSSGKWVTIAGQDFTALLIAIQWPPEPNGRARKVPVGERLDRTIEKIFREADPEDRLHLFDLEVRGIDPGDLPIVGRRETRGNRRGIAIEQETSYWDVLYGLAERYGFTLLVEGDKLVLSRWRAITDPDAPEVKKLAWGRNLESLELERELGKEQAPTVVVTGYDQKARKVIRAEFPEGTRKVTTKNASDPKAGNTTGAVRNHDEYTFVRAGAVSDPAILKRIAEERYYQLGRAQRRVIAVTRDLRDLRDADLLTLQVGDAVTIDWDAFNRELIADPAVPRAQKVAHLVGRGFDQAIAEMIADAYGRLDALRRPLVVRSVSYDYTAERGVSIEIELVNFIVIDGVRDPAAKQSRNAKRGDKFRRPDGTRAGWSPEREDAAIRRTR